MTVRGVISVILFVLGAWILSSGVLVAWMNVGQGLSMQLTMFGVFCAFSAVFLLLAVWATPGRRLRELGLTVLISAGVGGSMALVMALILSDPSFKRLMPPEQKMPDFKFAPLTGIAAVLVVGAIGWLLYRRSPAPADGK